MIPRNALVLLGYIIRCNHWAVAVRAVGGKGAVGPVPVDVDDV
jgi:hypothetical protein